MGNEFVISDTHFCHKKLIENSESGFSFRPFNSIEEHDETLISNWNSVVSPSCKVIHLGDFAMGSIDDGRIENILKRLNGLDTLIAGNHCTNAKLKLYSRYFKNICSYKVYGKETIIMSHIPIHSSQLDRFKFNVHGHTHKDFILLENGDIDKRYINVCVENINYTPLAVDEIFKRINQ